MKQNTYRRDEKALEVAVEELRQAEAGGDDWEDALPEVQDDADTDVMVYGNAENQTEQ